MKSSQQSIKIVLIDDHLLFRKSLIITLRLCDSKTIEIVGEAEDSKQGLQLIRETTPDVILLDISLKGSNGLDIAPQIKEIAPRAKILILTMHNGRNYISQAFKAGCRGYTLKSDPTRDLLKAINTVANGKTYISPAIPDDFPAQFTSGLPVSELDSERIC